MTLEKRLAALEMSAKLVACDTEPEITAEHVTQTLARFKEILTRELPPMTQDEMIAKVKADMQRLAGSWRHQGVASAIGR